LHDFADGKAIGWHGLEDAPDEQLTRVGDIVGHHELAVEYDPLQLGNGVGPERHRARHDKVEEYAQRPNVHVDAYVVVVFEQPSLNNSNFQLI
jgi:hypothetical protein